MPELPVAVIDLDVTRLGLVRNPSDVHGLSSGWNTVLNRPRHRLARRGGVGRPAANRDALEVDTQVGIDLNALLSGRLTPERNSDGVRRTAAAVSK